MSSVSAERALETPATAKVVRKVLIRLLPFLMALYLVAFLDRVAVSYAGPYGMNEDLGLSATVFGIASGIFTLGYVIFEVPSNLLLRRFGARKWLARIMLTWGVVQVLITFVPNGGWLIALRVLLGICEAGFSPGILFFLTLWVPGRVRSWAFQIFLLAAVIAITLGGLISVGFINLGGLIPLLADQAWRFIFLATGALALIGGIAILLFLVDTPDKAKWLNTEEKATLQAVIDVDAGPIVEKEHKAIEGLRNPRVLLITAVFFGFNFTTYVLIFFLPTIVAGFAKQFGTKFSLLEQAGLTAIPYAVGIVAALVCARIADRSGKPAVVVAWLALVGAIGSILAMVSTSPTMLLIAMSIVCIAINGSGGSIFGMVPTVVGGAAAAVGLAFMNSIGSLGGFLSPIVAGIVSDATGSQTITFGVMVCVFLAAGGIALVLNRSIRSLQQNPAPADAIAPSRS